MVKHAYQHHVFSGGLKCLLHDLVRCCYLVLEEGWNLAYPVNGFMDSNLPCSWQPVKCCYLVLEEGWNLAYSVNGFMDSNLSCSW